MRTLPVLKRVGQLGLTVLLGVACSSDASPPTMTGGSGGAAAGGSGGAAGTRAGSAGTPGGAAAESPDSGIRRDAAPEAATGGGDAAAAADRTPDAAATGGGCLIPVSESAQPALLSQTGCVDPSDPKKPAPGLIPYDVSSPLWSDGAEKTRFISLPAGGKVHVKDCTREPDSCNPAVNTSLAAYSDEGHWDMPVGTVLVKNFILGAKLIETRLYMRARADSRGWLGFSYEWNEAQTEATLLPSTGRATDRMVGNQLWHYPARSECDQCHTEEAGRSLGPSTQQMNFDFNYPSGRKNQVDELAARGLFEAPPTKAVGVYPTPAVTSSASLEARARSYMHTNCAICHRAGGVVDDVDLRFTNAGMLGELCNRPVKRGTGEGPPLRLVPGRPKDSALSVRMHALPTGSVGGLRMPKTGSLVVDAAGTKLIDDWITSIAACP